MTPAALAPDAAPVRYNPRYEAYARAHGRTVPAQIEQDSIDWPGGKMCGFILWNNDQIRAYGNDHPEGMMIFPLLGAGDSGRPAALIDHDGYDAWLLRKYP